MISLSNPKVIFWRVLLEWQSNASETELDQLAQLPSQMETTRFDATSFPTKLCTAINDDSADVPGSLKDALRNVPMQGIRGVRHVVQQHATGH